MNRYIIVKLLKNKRVCFFCFIVFLVFIRLMLFFSLLNLCIDVFHYFLQNSHYFLFQYYFYPFLSLTHLIDYLKFPQSFGYSDFSVMILICLFLVTLFIYLFFYVSVFNYFYKSTSNSTNSFLSCGESTGEHNEEIFHHLYFIVSFSSKLLFGSSFLSFF